MHNGSRSAEIASYFAAQLSARISTRHFFTVELGELHMVGKASWLAAGLLMVAPGAEAPAK
jgi:hypothetical protein